MAQNIKSAQNLVAGAYLATAVGAALLETGLLLSFSAEPPQALWALSGERRGRFVPRVER